MEENLIKARRTKCLTLGRIFGILHMLARIEVGSCELLGVAALARRSVVDELVEASGGETTIL